MSRVIEDQKLPVIRGGRFVFFARKSMKNVRFRAIRRGRLLACEYSAYCAGLDGKFDEGLSSG
jgi:hypothetical protein